ncbi:interleukin-6 receptor subunit alpha [Tachyglossus aculeatus]|uniref:interleukin-6 receptor subunit alpha n=1 Tax=Tachyglossus aculeatus TaxID=9261 RepID=UPI0018F777B5|nr:interleukin-6 receptor subunit alpha [Tachyglossus aculeatus]
MSCLVLAVLLVVVGEGLARGRCPPLGVPVGILPSAPGTLVTLPCPADGPGTDTDNDSASASASWSLEGRVLEREPGRPVLLNGSLLLGPVRPDHAGVYTCYRHGRLVQRVQLLVEAPPEVPQISCYRKSHNSNVLCEWVLDRPPSPRTQAALWVRHGSRSRSGEPRGASCEYLSGRRAFSCPLALPGWEDEDYVASACVANTVAGHLSPYHRFNSYRCVRPDAPSDVTVTSVAGRPRWLNVTWSYPPSWDSLFSLLRFQLRYRARASAAFTTLRMEAQSHWQLSHLISDAWAAMDHVVQLRAREEFDVGEWSAWSPEARATPWTDPRVPVARTEASKSPQPPLADDHFTKLPTGQPDKSGSDSLPRLLPSGPQYSFLVAGGSLILGMALFVGIMIRYWRTWKKQGKLKAGKASGPPQCPWGRQAAAWIGSGPVLASLISGPGPASPRTEPPANGGRPPRRAEGAGGRTPRDGGRGRIV